MAAAAVLRGELATAAAGKEAEEQPRVCPPVAMEAARNLDWAKEAPQQAMKASPVDMLQSTPICLQGLSPFNRLRQCLDWWRAHAPQFVLDLITQGVEPNFRGTGLRLHQQQKSEQEVALALEVIQDYISVGAAREVSPQGTRYLVPWFVIQKVEPSGKVKNRLISDCREINKELHPPKFKLDHWRDIFPHLERGMWGTKVDLKNAYFHLELSKALKPFIRMKVGDRVFQMEGACFGLSTLPFLWMEVMSVFLKKWRKMGLLVFIYLDDILLLTRSKSLAEKQTTILVNDLVDSGMEVNLKKSQLNPTQKLEHLGFQLDLEQGLLQVPTQKLKSVRKELGKFVVQDRMTCRKAAAILGQLRSFLTALPVLRAFSDMLVKFTDQHRKGGWDQNLAIPKELKEQVVEIGQLLKNWQGRSFQGQSPVRKIYSDSSTQGWGALDLTSGAKLHEFWRSEKGLHINIKELKASIAAVQSLAKPGETVFLTVDNQVAYSYLRKGGGRLPVFNSLLRPFLTWCHQNSISLVPNWVKSEEMLADSISRWQVDRGDYTLRRSIFQKVCGIFAASNFQPVVDCFASPGNAQLPKFISRWPHSQATAVNALECSLEHWKMVYANPPWKIILPWLIRLKQNPHLQCLTVVPFWVGTVWWPLLIRLQDRKFPAVKVPPTWGMFSNCLGEEMPPPGGP